MLRLALLIHSYMRQQFCVITDIRFFLLGRIFELLLRPKKKCQEMTALNISFPMDPSGANTRKKDDQENAEKVTEKEGKIDKTVS